MPSYEGKVLYNRRILAASQRQRRSEAILA
jgi:hypothetical protein